MEKMMKIGRNILFVIILLYTTHAYAVPELKFGIAGEKADGTALLDLSVRNGSGTYAGFNAKILLPKGITVSGISKGELLSSGSFVADFRPFSDASHDGAVLIAYSGTDTFGGNGVLMKLSLRIADSLAPGTADALFATVNEGTVNSRYALADVSSTSLTLTPAPGYIAVGHEDADADGIPDTWERIITDQNPSMDINTFAPQTDFDNDGSCNIAEFFNNTDPTDPDSHRESLTGDMSGDRDITLADTITALQIICGIRVPVNPDAASGKTKQIKLQDAVFTLQAIADSE